MTITSVVKKGDTGTAKGNPLFLIRVRFAGAADYVDGGSDELSILRAGIGKNVTPLEVIKTRVVAGTTKTYAARIVQTAAAVLSAAAAWPVADQDGNTLTYILNGAAEATLTLSGAHTTAAQLAASINAVTGIHAYVDDDGQVQVRTDRTGEDADLQITGGTANAVYLFPTTANVGTDDPLLAIYDDATGLDVGANDPSLDLSAYTFECTMLCE